MADAAVPEILTNLWVDKIVHTQKHPVDELGRVGCEHLPILFEHGCPKGNDVGIERLRVWRSERKSVLAAHRQVNTLGFPVKNRGTVGLREGHVPGEFVEGLGIEQKVIGVSNLEALRRTGQVYRCDLQSIPIPPAGGVFRQVGDVPGDTGRPPIQMDHRCIGNLLGQAKAGQRQRARKQSRRNHTALAKRRNQKGRNRARRRHDQKHDGRRKTQKCGGHQRQQPGKANHRQSPSHFVTACLDRTFWLFEEQGEGF